jgi:flagellin
LNLYQTEYNNLASQLSAMTNEEFNGIDILNTSSVTSLTVRTSEDGNQTVGVTIADLNSIYTAVSSGSLLSNATATSAVSTLNTQIERLASMRATNGSEQSRLTFAADMLSVNKANLEAANSRIIDVDVARESSQLARFNILQQAGVVMLAQANQASQSVLRLLA